MAEHDRFDTHGRELPSTSSRDPWLVLVSELMLQQIQVARVLERVPQFITCFRRRPTVRTARPAT